MPILLASLLATLLLVSPSSPPPPRATAPQAPAPRIERGYLRVQGLERAPLVEALALRIPHVPLEAFETTTKIATGAMVAFVDVQREPSRPDSAGLAFALTVVISDGRAFDRRIETASDDDDVDRLVASTIANLLLAIEAGTVVADRGNVPLPAPDAPTCPACACPEPTTEAATRPAEPPEPHPPTTPPPRFELGPTVVLATTLGLGAPAEADRFASTGAQLGLHARSSRGALLGIELRAHGRGGGVGTSMARLRAALGAGYELRRGGWSLGASLWGTIEPWWFRGAPIDPPPRPLLGLAARVSPALHVPRLAGRPMALTLGPVLELAASASFGNGTPTVALVVIREQGRDRNQLRAGGLELSTGLAATLWFGPTATRDR